MVVYSTEDLGGPAPDILPQPQDDENEVSSTTCVDDDVILAGYQLMLQEYGDKTSHTIRLLNTKECFQNSVKVIFKPTHISVQFATQKQLSQSVKNCGDGQTIKYKWESDLYEPIDILQSKYSLNSNGLLEVRLVKTRSSPKWPHYSPYPPPVPPAPPAPPPSVVPINSAIKLKTKHDSLPLCDSSDIAGPSGVRGGQAIDKPTCSVNPYLTSPAAQVGYTGLRNIGNTCFINSTVQVLVNTRELREYFLSDKFYVDLNSVNPLGMKGHLALAFADFMSNIWSGEHSIYAPSTLRSLVSNKATQFANFAQHDAQEFLSFLVDGLHEDLNRVIDKKVTERIEGNGEMSDKQVADIAWKTKLLRDDSIIQDLFAGQLKSKLECLHCPKVSYTFDPFTTLILPFPRKKKTILLIFWPVNLEELPKRMCINLTEDSNLTDLLNSVAKQTQTKVANLMAYEVFSYKIFQIFKADFPVKNLQPNDIIHIAEMVEGNSEDVRNIIFMQRFNNRDANLQPTCAMCAEDSAKRYIACSVCQRVYYCNEKCMNEHKEIHEHCRFDMEVKVGQPFFVSLPLNKVNYANICSAVEIRAKYSINVFQPPVRTKASQSSEKMEVDDPIQNHSQIIDDQQSILFKLRKSTKEGTTDYEDNPKGLPISPAEFSLEASDFHFLSVDWITKNGNVDCLTVESKNDDANIFKMDYEDLVDPGQNLCKEAGEVKINELLDRFTETETLSDEEAWYCSNCKTNREARKTMNIWKLPGVLVVQLKRFVYSLSWAGRTKNDTKVIYPLDNFDLKNYVCPGADPQSTIYDLYGVVCHTGSSYYGHYISYARLNHLIHSQTTEVGWRKFDDSHVSDVTNSSDVVVDSAYLLFYKRRDQIAPNWLTKYEMRGEEMRLAKQKWINCEIIGEERQDIDLPLPDTKNDVIDSEGGIIQGPMNRQNSIDNESNENMDESVPEDPNSSFLEKMKLFRESSKGL